MAIVTLNKEDLRTDLHPFLWAEVLEQLDLPDLPESRADYPESVTLYVRKAEAD